MAESIKLQNSRMGTIVTLTQLESGKIKVDYQEQTGFTYSRITISDKVNLLLDEKDFFVNVLGFEKFKYQKHIL